MIAKSTGLIAALTTLTPKQALDGSYISFYSGTVPASPDDSLGSAVELCRITMSGTGIILDDSPMGGEIVKSKDQSWQTTMLMSAGTISFFRIREQSDTGAYSQTLKRVQGIPGDGVYLSSTVLAYGGFGFFFKVKSFIMNY